MRVISLRVTRKQFERIEQQARERGESVSMTARHLLDQALNEEASLRRDVTLMHVLQIGGIINKLAAHVSYELLQKGKEDGLRMAEKYGLISLGNRNENGQG